MLRAIVIFSASIVVAGCTGGGSGGAGAGGGKLSQETPKETVLSMQSALMGGNRDNFLACCKAEGEQKKALSSIFDMSQEMSKLKASVEKTYGAEGWQQFKGPDGMQMKMGLEIADMKKIEQAQVEVQGDQATVKIPDDPTAIKLLKEGGKWVVDAKEMFKGMPGSDQVSKMIDTMKAPIAKVIGEVGKPGQTPATLADMLKSEMVKAMMGAAGDLIPKGLPQGAAGAPGGAPQIPMPAPGADDAEKNE